MITMASALLAFILELIVWDLQRWRVPQAAGSFIAFTLLLGSVYGVCHFSYNNALAFLDDLPIPKVIGKRLRLNPLVVTIALLVWGWIWGAMGLILAIPMTGTMKIIFDHIDSLHASGRWLEK
jgi:predicted PurR-regulated permease PerM